MAAIQPIILTWARETAGLSLADAAHALDLKTAWGRSGAERLAALEGGVGEPTRPLLLKMVKAYRRPLLVFYLAEPPQTGYRGEDFRSVPGLERHNPELDALVRDIKARQGLIRSMLEDDDAPPVDFIGIIQAGFPVEVLTGRITERVGFSLDEFRARKNVDDAFAYLRERIEAAGVFVLLLGNLGSHHTNIPVDIFRGFALADTLAPMIVINDQDSRAAWSFTAVHELVHLWLGQTGISGTDTGNQIEQYCNDVAGEILLPTAEMHKFARDLLVTNFEKTVDEITMFAEARRVSRPMVAYRLLRSNLIPKLLWIRLNSHYVEQWQRYKEREAEKNREAEGGPSYYVVRRHRVGPALLGLVRRSLDEGIITYTKASRVLGVKPRNVEPLLSTVRGAR